MRIILLLPILFLTGCSIFSGSYPSLVDESQFNSLATDISAETGWLVYQPPIQPDSALVFYPGGKVEPTAYSLLAHDIATQLGLLVIVVPMPLDLAVLGGNRGTKVQEFFPNISDWHIGGHSLGGTMAASLAFKSPDNWQGLALLASYPQDKHNFADSDLAIISIIGDRDGLISQETWQNSLTRLPEDAIQLVIKGGNHAGFGNYGVQEGDLTAAIKKADQRQQTIDALAQWLGQY
jgi:poly(3-hydroxybutyrate) depolymerase